MESLSTSPYLFVYSSLLKGFQTPEYTYIHQYFQFEGPAKVKGILSDMGNFVTGTPVHDDRFIHGELYSSRNHGMMNFAIGQLDEYEGVHPEADEDPLYIRSLAHVYPESGSEVLAWIYWFAGDISGKPVISSGRVTDYSPD